MLKVWNISDATDRPRNLDLLNQSILPGKFGLIPEERSRHIQRLVDAGVAFIGEQPPAKYLMQKRKALGTGAPKRVQVEMPAPPEPPAPVEAKQEPPAPEPEVEAPAEEVPETLQDDMESMRKKDLIALCEERGLETEGTRRELIARLQG